MRKVNNKTENIKEDNNNNKNIYFEKIKINKNNKEIIDENIINSGRTPINKNSKININNLRLTENSMNTSNNNNNIKIKNDNNNGNNSIKLILDTKIFKYAHERNLNQKRYEQFMNINSNTITNINNKNKINIYNNNLSTKESNNLFTMNNSKKFHKSNNSKKHSLNEARYEKKLKNEINSEKRRDLSLELNHINAENFINRFKDIKCKPNELPLFDKTANNLKNNILLTQETQITNTTNTHMERNKGLNNQNLTVNMENNCQIETKENDSTNFKTDQSKILKTDDIYQDLVNSLKNAPFKFKHK
jgi:hypothetical protein